MTGFLLDTNVISELVGPRPDARVVAWIEGVDESLLYLSVLTIGEIRKGVAGLPHGSRRTRLGAWLKAELEARFEGRILPIDTSIADRWGSIAAEAKRRGSALPVIDGLLAAMALRYDLTLVSRNVDDFAGTRISVLNPWAS